MKTESPEGPPLAATLDAILRELRRLDERVTALEANATLQGPAAHVAQAAAVPAAEELSEELVVVIGAAVAAYLGKKAHIRQVRLLGSAPWVQQGRATVQASHRLEGRADRRHS
jgi:methylmalonyl-CoA carboxyltransferase large subunit